MPFVYIVRCADGSLYTGYAEDVARRVAAHNAGKGARYTSGRRPVHLVFTEACASRGEALRREHQLKTLARRDKEAVVAAFRRAARRPRARKANGGEPGGPAEQVAQRKATGGRKLGA